MVRSLTETSALKIWFLLLSLLHINLCMATPGLGQLIHNLPAKTKKSIRLLEKCNLKITREKCSLLYNDIYIYMPLIHHPTTLLNI